MGHVKYGLSGAALPLLAVVVQPVWAQDDGPLILEEVIVTATKREASLQDVAVAVTAVPDWVLADNQIVRTEQLTDLVPSLTLQAGTNPRQSSFNIRGIGTRSFSTAAEPSVSTMVDGVVMGRSGQAFAQLPDVQRVEVLRGPQGTLFGKNASAGLIHIITKNPTPEHEGEVVATAVQQNEYRIAATAAGPIANDWGYRLTASYIDDEGYIDNRYDPALNQPETPDDPITLNNSVDTLNGKIDRMVRGKLRWEPTSSFDIMYTGDWSKTDCDCLAPTIRVAADPNLILPVQIGEENDEVNVDGPTFANTEATGHQLDINWDIGNHTLTSISAWRNWDIQADNDNDAQPVLVKPLELLQTGDTEQEQFSQELRLTSPADWTVSYVLGLYFFDQTVDRRFDRQVTVGQRFNAISTMTADTRNYAAFGEATWNITDRWRLIFGGRYTVDELAYEYGRSVTPAEPVLPGMEPVEPGDPGWKGDTDNSDFSGKLALQWDFSDIAMTYLSYVQGYKGPAYDLDATTDVSDLEPVNPETSDAYELGLKSRLFDNRVTLNLAAFFTRFHDWQAQAFVPNLESDDPNAGGFRLSNAGEVSTRGIELDITALPVENFTLYTAVAYVRAEIDEYVDGPCNFQQQTAGIPPECLRVNGGQQDLSGGDMPYSPDWRITISGNYLLPLESVPFSLSFKGTYRWQSEVQFDVTQDPNTVQDAYGILDLAIELQTDNQHHSVTGFVKNVTDQFYVNGINPTSPALIQGGYMQSVPKLAQRTAGLEYRYRWF